MQKLSINLVAETTEIEFKENLELKKPKSWLKTVSAFSNGIGGTIYFGVNNDREIVGLEDTQGDVEKISELIKSRIEPLANFNIEVIERKDENTGNSFLSDSIYLLFYHGHGSAGGRDAGCFKRGCRGRCAGRGNSTGRVCYRRAARKHDADVCSGKGQCPQRPGDGHGSHGRACAGRNGLCGGAACGRLVQNCIWRKNRLCKAGFSGFVWHGRSVGGA